MPEPGEVHLFGWYLGVAITVIVIAVVVALLAPILVLAARIARHAPQINQTPTAVISEHAPVVRPTTDDRPRRGHHLRSGTRTR